ncbi:hypothetical protein [Roseateles sp.]|uniref:hypothetical protein n=1 Tax=Roseateles sp. TaxID=1971397 RepID=UPI0025D9BD9B|nr:hypothetical protein [Roseateles sp.]MBV8037155.1 hypothetical protein [Roseateles sp.]
MQFIADQHPLKGLGRMAIVRHPSACPGQSRAAPAKALRLTGPAVGAPVKAPAADRLTRPLIAAGRTAAAA